MYYFTPAQWSCWGVYWFHSVRLSVRPSVHPSVRPTSHVRSVASAVLVGSISYLYILSSNFRRCVACKVSCQISKFEVLAIFKICNFDFVFYLTWDLMWITSMGNHGAAGGISECSRSSFSICKVSLLISVIHTFISNIVSHRPSLKQQREGG